MAYSNPNTQAAIEAYAAANNLSVKTAEHHFRNYENTFRFESGDFFEERWATNLLEKGSKVVLLGGRFSSDELVEVTGVLKTTVKVGMGNREQKFNRRGLEHGNAKSAYAQRIVQYVEGLFEAIQAEEKSRKEAELERMTKVNAVESKSKAIARSARRELTEDQLNRLHALFGEFEAEDKAAKQAA